MSSTMKPVISQGNKTPPISSQIPKQQIHPQPIPATYGQQQQQQQVTSHMPQNLINVPHNISVHANHFPSSNTTIHQNANTLPSSTTITTTTTTTTTNTSISNKVTVAGHDPSTNINQNQISSQTIISNVQTSPNQQQSSIREKDVEEKVQSNGTVESAQVKETTIKPVKDKVDGDLEKIGDSSNVEKKDENKEKIASFPANVERKQLEENIIKLDDSSNCSSADSIDSSELIEKATEKPISISSSSNASESTSTPVSSENTAESKPVKASNEGETKKEDDKQLQSGEGGKEVSKNQPAKQISSSNVKSSTLKLATTARMPMRKPKAKLDSLETVKSTSKNEKSQTQRTPISMAKAKRNRFRTQHYQSPLPEVEMISKMTNTTTPRNKNNEDKLIVFFKNEFLAVRNTEGSFYVCQAVQNIYKSSSKIRIRWLSQDKNDKSGELYTPDFYDYTDFDCILTNLNLTRIEKGKFRLPSPERIRTDNILKRAIAAETGDSVTSLTEEHPDGIDLSLYKEESQLQKNKRRSKKRKASSPLRSPKKSLNEKRVPEVAKVRKVATSSSSSSSKQSRNNKTTSPPQKTAAAKKSTTVVAKKVTATTRNERAKKRQKDSPPATTTVDSKKAKVIAKMAKKKVTGATLSTAKVNKSATLKKSRSSAVSKGQKQSPGKQQSSSQQQQQLRKSRRGTK